MLKNSKPELHLLTNGIPVVLQNTEGTVAATYWWVRAGSADEAPKEAGFAHFLEHMLFKDAAAKETGKASTGQMARAIESLGGDINAYTSFDQTVYHVTCAAHHWEHVLDEFGTMARPQKFLNDDFKREREVILEELKKNNDSPGRKLFQSLFSETFNRHPYGKPVIGYVRTLNAAKVGELEAFYRKHYSASNMGVILVGPIGGPDSPRRKSILKLVEKRFGEKVHKPKAYTRLPRRSEPELRKDVATAVTAFDVKTPTLAVSFRVPDLRHPDVPALDILSGILGMGELSRLYQRLFYKDSLVTEVAGGMYVPNDSGMLYFQLEAEDLDRARKAYTVMLEEFVRLAEEGPTQEELSRVLVNSESDRLYSTQTADGMASRIGFMKFVVGDMDFDADYIEELRAVSARRVQEVAREYLDHRRMSICLLVPKEHSKYDLAPLAKEAERALPGVAAKGSVPRTASRKPGQAGPEVIRLPSGARLVYRHNPASHVISLHGAALGGLRLELADPVGSPGTSWGASNLMALTWSKGAKTADGRTMDAREIAREVEGRAASMDGFGGRNTVGLQLTGLARDWQSLSRVFVDTLVRPTFPEDELEHSRRVAEDEIRGIEDHTSQVCSQLFLETLYETHPYGHLSTGSLESLRSIDAAMIREFHRRWMHPSRLVISAAGNIRPAELTAWAEELDRSLAPFAEQRAHLIPESLPVEHELTAPRWAEKTLGREQIHILVGGLGTRIGSEDRWAIRLMQNILGGQSGRLFIELREKKSLAYTVSPVSVEGLEPGYIGTYIACSPGKREEAIQGIRTVLEALAAKGPTEAELSRAREFYLGRRAMDLQSDSSLAAHHGLEELYGMRHLTEDEIARRVRGVNAKQVREACRKYLVAPHMVTSVVG